LDKRGVDIAFHIENIYKRSYAWYEKATKRGPNKAKRRVKDLPAKTME